MAVQVMASVDGELQDAKWSVTFSQTGKAKYAQVIYGHLFSGIYTCEHVLFSGADKNGESDDDKNS